MFFLAVWQIIDWICAYPWTHLFPIRKNLSYLIACLTTFLFSKPWKNVFFTKKKTLLIHLFRPLHMPKPHPTSDHRPRLLGTVQVRAVCMQWNSDFLYNCGISWPNRLKYLKKLFTVRGFSVMLEALIFRHRQNQQLYQVTEVLRRSFKNYIMRWKL